ncbi:MAG: hypothetical protein EPN79_02125 [Burkholderiaceae bacterium]|nr:MAG: hypothetical protein EPN79_02125 [Burkholderiaceae bacterium]TBR76166.1 MAG: hypothetical protein EPN64_09150 [Burkholderiaceae bacterium]
MKFTYTVRGAEGTRTSARPYTHAVIGRRSGPKVADAMQTRHDAEWPFEEKRARNRYSVYVRNAKSSVGGLRINHSGYVTQCKDYEIELAKEAVERAPSADAYVAEKKLEALSAIERMRAEGIGDLLVLSWHHSRELAENALRQIEWAHTDVRVVPCVAGPTTKKARP